MSEAPTTPCPLCQRPVDRNLVDRLNFVINYLRLPLGIDPSLKNDDVPAMLDAFQQALDSLDARSKDRAPGHK